MKKFILLLFFAHPSIIFAETLTLNCSMNGTITTEDKKISFEEVINRNYVLTLTKEVQSLGMSVDDEKGHPEITLSWSKDRSIGKALNQSNEDRYYLSEIYGDEGMKTSESVELNRKTGVVGIKKFVTAKNYERSYYLTGNCLKIEKNKF